MMKKCIVLTLLVMAFAAINVSAAVYTGSLSCQNDTADGWFADASNATMGWRKSSVLSWTVSDEEDGRPGTGFDWFYSYTITVDKFAPVRWMIVTGEGFTTDDIAGISVTGADAIQTYTWSLGTWSADDDLRDMPEDRYGIRFVGTSEGGAGTGDSINVSFWSRFAPQWADLYANCGGHGNLGYNQGFSLDNPTDAIASGTIDNHVLTPLPEPAVVSLMAMAWLMVLIGRRIRSR